MKYRLTPLFLAFLLTLGACSGNPPAGSLAAGSGHTPLVVFAAGSLILPFGDLEKAFEARYPKIEVQAQYHGSIQVIRHATELHQPIDVVATADASLIPMLMYATNDPDTGLPYADWYIRFASNRLAIAFRPSSLYADEINADNWYSILARPDVRVGIADPRFDAVGYRALMVYALAQNYYQNHTLFTSMFNGLFTFPFGIFKDGDQTLVTVPEIVETKANSHILVRGASIQLIALLESGDLDYAFEYESVIRQHDLQMVSLPEALNLGSADQAANYITVKVSEAFQRFATVKPEFVGERIGYGITIPSNAPHPQEAELFIAFLLGPEGRAIMQADFHPVFDVALGSGYKNIPTDLQALCAPLETP
jgi:molybdate/tungstate transport system substrate-binding protein